MYQKSWMAILHKLSNLIGIMSVVLPIIFWNKIPEKIPSHFNGVGEVDHWSDKPSIVLLFLAIFVMMGLMNIVVYYVKTSMVSKYSSEWEKSEIHIVYPMLISLNLIMMILFSYIMFCCVTCRPLGVWFLPVFVIGTAIPIIYFIYKCGKVKGLYKKDTAAYKSIEQQEQGHLYRSAVDWWLGGILLGSELLMVWVAIEPIIKHRRFDMAAIVTAVIVTLITIPLFDIKYVLYSEHMLVSMSIYGKLRLRYADIVSVKKTFNPLSSAALSLKRTQIDYVEDGRHHMVLISPKKRNEFLQILKEKAPHVRVES